jgi:hypothetical protein
MKSFRNSPFEGTLEVVGTLSEDAMNASLRELREQDRLTMGLRQALRCGVSIDDLSAVTGLTPKAIRARCARELHFGEDLNTLAGC